MSEKKASIAVFGGTPTDTEMAGIVQPLFEQLQPLMHKHIAIENKIYDYLKTKKEYSYPACVYDLIKILNDANAKIVNMFTYSIAHHTLWQSGRSIGTVQQQEIKYKPVSRNPEFKDISSLEKEIINIRIEMHKQIFAYLQYEKEFTGQFIDDLKNADYIGKLVEDAKNSYAVWFKGKNSRKRDPENF